MLTRKRILFAGILVSSFVVGAYFWKINHTGAFFWRAEEHPESAEDLDFTVFVGDYLITREEVEWEYKLYMAQITAPEVGSESEARPLEKDKGKTQKLSPKINLELYNKILADLIERKLLYQYLSKDSKFSLNDISRYTECMQEFAAASKSNPSIATLDKDRQNLKSMLCERSLLSQYVKERVGAEATPSEEQIRSYYNANKQKLVEPARVVIRQIVLGSEDDAKKLRDRVNSTNFIAMAKEHSISPEAKDGGLLGPFAKGDLPSVFDVAFEMKPGAVQGILKSTYGFHIIMLEKKLPRVELTYEAAKTRITKELTLKRQDEEYKKWVETALNSIPIKSSRGF